ncbi:response regulator transcription factor [Paenibacillus thalictri]|uniref:Response regulator transcription factor n=1 Tax=Paenibacillus thalictri TaxID=2527873 RepID=A0A4Q9DUP9_9BACL|nr:response regulator transcription factor [Paenibacillus thalictri]TBL79975.1 response regulator transcription factor [Paenibacillus thalictri]
MLKVLLVDDERIIVDGISRIVDWASAGTMLAGTARNGEEAYDRILQDPPDIVLSDIRMPGMDGLALVAKTRESHPHIRFILMSGFSEFEYARSAMQHGVKHYLLKPCNENKIVEALRELAEELDQTKRKEQFVSHLRDGMNKVLPHVKEQFLKEFVTNKTYGSTDWEYYRKLFCLPWERQKIRLILFQLEKSFEFEHMFAVKNIAEELLGSSVLSTTVGKHVLIVLEDWERPEELHERIAGIRRTFLEYYKVDITAALSEADEMVQARSLYKQTLECLKHRFYLGEGSLITQRDLPSGYLWEPKEFTFDEECLILHMKSGCWEEAEKWIGQFFKQLAALRSDIHTVKSYVIQLFMSIVRLSEPSGMNRNMGKLVELTEMETLSSIESFFCSVAEDITRRIYENNVSKHSAIVRKMEAIVTEQLGNSELSLNWVARQMLYMNADYLGKLFRKETGEKFSNYVMRERVAKATKLISQNNDVKIFELAEQLGFGDNPQYFSQVFKRYAGCTPSEFMKLPS